MSCALMNKAKVPCLLSKPKHSNKQYELHYSKIGMFQKKLSNNYFHPKIY